VLGVALIGDEHPDNERTLAEFGGVPVLGRLPRIEPLTARALAEAFSNAFRREVFEYSGGERRA
jgi:dethiobiotin synthetase